MAEEDKSDQKQPEPKDVKLEHKHNYIGGPYAYKNSSRSGRHLDPENLTELVLMTKPGRASKMNIALPEEDHRAGIFPQHNSPDDFRVELELLAARTLDPYSHLSNITNLNKAGFKERKFNMTKQRLGKIKAQFSHLSELAFNQMLDITRPDKRDYPAWYKILKKSNQVLIAYPAQKTEFVNFVQVIQYSIDNKIIGLKHCTFVEGKPLVINETLIDKFYNLRQIAHMGYKDASPYANSVERFDDGTVSWIITKEDSTGAAALRPNGEIQFIENIINDHAKIAARNLGAEKVNNNGKWTGEFSLDACSNKNPHILQETFKTKVRKQISQIVDGASIPGLDPIFWINI